MSLSATNIKISEYVKIITDPITDDWETGVKLQKTIRSVSDSVSVG